jgi:hypothetical protein
MDPILVVVVAVVAGGVGLIWLARFSRRQSQVLKARGIVEWRDGFTSWGAPRSFALLFFGPQPKALERLGIALAVLTAVAVVVSAVAMVVVIYLARS